MGSLLTKNKCKLCGIIYDKNSITCREAYIIQNKK